jgi:hypothetical protein
MSKPELITELQNSLSDALEQWGIQHDMNCVSMPPWDNPTQCDCGRGAFIKRCRELIEAKADAEL